MAVSIRAPREGGDDFLVPRGKALVVSIRAPREGGDDGLAGDGVFRSVSIRAPREGGDVNCFFLIFFNHRFNPRPP